MNNPQPLSQALWGLGAILLFAWTVIASVLVAFGVLSLPHWLAWGPLAFVLVMVIHYACIAALVRVNTRAVLLDILAKVGEHQTAEANRKKLN